MLRRAVLAGAVVCFAASPASAVKDWYDHYQDALGLIEKGQFEEAERQLNEAIKLRPASALRERTYGVHFVDYLPYYHLGVCYLRTERYSQAVDAFDLEEDKGAIRRDELHAELVALREEAQDAQQQRNFRLLKDELEEGIREAQTLFEAGRNADALDRLVPAEVISSKLDPETQQRVIRLKAAIRADLDQKRRATERTEQIRVGLERARSRLASDPGQALQHFDEVLGLDPRNAEARRGKLEAERRIVAINRAADFQRKFEQGRTHYEAGRYEEALPLLTEAAVDLPQAADLRDRTRRLLEGVREQRRVQRSIAELERLVAERLDAGEFQKAYVELQSLLELDPGHVRAAEQFKRVEARLGADIVKQLIPNYDPKAAFLVPEFPTTQGVTQARAVLELEGDTLQVVGAATDESGVSRVEFRIGDRLVEEQQPSDPAALESSRIYRFKYGFPLEPGLNQLSITVVDDLGLSTTYSIEATRNLRFYETAAFFPTMGGAAVGFLALGLAVQHARRRRAFRSRFNPYIAGAPVLDGEMVFGRQALMSRILNVLHHNSLVITGERRIGKTTFLYQLKKVLEADQDTEYRFFPVMVDLQGVPESGFFHALMSEIVDNLELSEAALGTLRFLPKSEDYDGRDFSHDVRLVVDELKTRTSGHVKLALLIDEVDALNEYSERINQRLRSIFMKTFSEHLVTVMSGVGIKRTWKSEGSPWYNFFDEIELGGLSREAAEALIRTPVEGVFRFDHSAVQAILDHTDMKPYLIQKYCIHVVNHIIEERRTTVTAKDVEAVQDAVRFEGRDATPRERASA
jgi:tetratricopeptide (TPR) repeat protein